MTQLSLHLKLLEDVTTNDAYQFTLTKDKILPNLSRGAYTFHQRALPASEFHRLKYPRDHVPAHFRAVLIIAGEVSSEKFLFVQETPDKTEYREESSDEPPVRTER